MVEIPELVVESNVDFLFMTRRSSDCSEYCPDLSNRIKVNSLDFDRKTISQVKISFFATMFHCPITQLRSGGFNNCSNGKF
jgi:hypothetical protein